MSVKKSAGIVTAYGSAVQGGYTGTYEEFCALLAKIPNVINDLENMTVNITTLAAGSSATASYADGVLTLGIPKGDKGDKGDKGEKGNKGDTGETPAFSIGTVTTGAAGTNAAATITGTAAAPVLNLTIPKGADGAVPAAAIAGTEATTTASKAYAVGDRFFLGGTLYVATAPIASGGTITVSGSGANCKADVLGDDVSDLKESLDETRIGDGKNIFNSEWLLSDGITKDGNGVTGTLTKFYNNFYNTPILIQTEASTRYTFSCNVVINPTAGTTGGGLFVIFHYSDNSKTNAIVVPNSTQEKTAFSATSLANKTLVGIGFAYGSNSLNVCTITDIQLEIGAFASEYVPYYTAFDRTARAMNPIVEKVGNFPLMRNGSVGDPGYANSIATDNIIPTNGASSIKVFVEKALSSQSNHYAINYTTYNISSGKTGVSTSANRVVISKPTIDTFEIPITNSEKGFAFDVFEVDTEGAYVPLRITDFKQDEIIYVYSYQIDKSNDGYVVGVDFLKKYLSSMKLGKLTYLQSFCIYNGKYYSTDGSNIGVQNADFTSVSAKALSVGHANNFQLGHNGKAYISGWDDNKVYVVDLETIEIESVISLGATGYTTAVIDDLNHIAYIFQRDTFPNTQENYNFITYNYQTQTIISQRIINSFSALQSVDFYNGRIIAIWGSGTVASPSGMAIYNTNGDILAEYYLDTIASAEPEGVFIDRETKDLYISVYARDVYKVKQLF